jgi:hypothetical protein
LDKRLYETGPRTPEIHPRSSCAALPGIALLGVSSERGLTPAPVRLYPLSARGYSTYIRPTPNDWRWVKTVEEAVDLISSGEVVEASLDHDLGSGEQEGYKLT